eukprot:m.52612 g.52612  ORF g.52612 m.52612 type:complete len:400 (+) comp9115_c0_seq1:153-1352(+)
MWRNGWHRANCGHGILRWHPRRPQSIRRVQTNQAAAPQNIPQPPLSAVLKHAFAASVPLIGFGFMDQIVMVTVGERIDYLFGATLGLHTLAAAALGQVVSDMSGVVFGQTIDKFARDIGLPPSGLTDAQQTLLRVRGFRLAGMTLGVAFGCFVGMVPLLFYDLDKREREEKNAALEPLMRSVVDSCHQLIVAEHCHLWLVDPSDSEYLWSRGIHTAGPKDENLREAFDFVTNSSGCVTAHDLLPVVGSIGRETNRQKVQKKLMRIESNLRLESNYRQSGRIKDRVFSYPVFAEYMRQEVSAGKEVCVRIRPGGFKHTALHTKKSVVCESAQESTLFNKVHNRVTGLHTRNILVSPIISEKSGKVLGIIEMANKIDGTFSEHDVHIVELMTRHAAVFLEK